MALKRMKCPICHNLKNQYFLETVNTHGSFRISEEKFIILRCSNCEVIFPRVAVNKNFYKKYYFPNYYMNTRLPSPILQSTYRFVANFFSRIQLGRYLKLNTGRVLDFGCGQGDFLTSLPPTIKKYGVEINQKAIKFIKEKYPEIKIFRTWEKLKSSRIKFDLITLWHVLEHLEKPREVLKQLARRLRRGGYLIISTPNSNSWGLKWGQEYWFHLDTPRHLAIFNFNNLINLCRQLSLRPITIKGGVIDYPLDFFWSIYNRFKAKNFFLNFWLGLVILPLSIMIKILFLFFSRKSETIILVCKKG